jgi:hypothetical protein
MRQQRESETAEAAACETAFSSGACPLLVNGQLMACESELVGRRDAGKSGADHCNSQGGSG